MTHKIIKINFTAFGSFFLSDFPIGRFYTIDDELRSQFLPAFLLQFPFISIVESDDFTMSFPVFGKPAGLSDKPPLIVITKKRRQPL
jgi:hypothetical protein